MNYKYSLRERIVVYFVAFAAGLSSLISLGFYYASEQIEMMVLNEQLHARLEFELHHEYLSVDSSRASGLDSWLYFIQHESNLLPAAVTQLPLGLHKWRDDQGNNYLVLVSAHQQGRVYLLKSAAQLERHDFNTQLVLFSIVLCSIALSWWLSLWLSNKLVEPVSLLAQKVAQLSPGGSAEFPLLPHHPQDEIATLASTLEHFFIQNQKYIQREQEFTADASHELRTPLAVIRGATELLLESPNLANRETQQVQRIDRAAERMSQMLEILLLLARETADARLQDEQVDIAEVVEEVIEQHRFLLCSDKVKINRILQDNIKVLAKKSIVVSIISNVLRNAIQHTTQGEISLQMQGRSLLIRDTGCGISEQDLALVFERFYRSDNDNTGSGIGLALVKRLCGHYGWQINLASRMGVGTEVRIVFVDLTKS